MDLIEYIYYKLDFKNSSRYRWIVLLYNQLFLTFLLTPAHQTGSINDDYNCVTYTDIDECLTNNGGCSADASCSNTVGSFTCICQSGYTGDGFTCSGK